MLLYGTLVALIIGICAHLVYFIHGEHDMAAPRIMWTHVMSFFVLLIVESTLRELQAAVWRSLVISSSYVFGLFASILTYRLFFHRLRKFPGPRMAAASKLWHTYHAFSCKNHEYLDALHKQYGDFVRTGPSELTVFEPAIKWAVDGPQNNCTKTSWYDILRPMIALNTSRSKAEHDVRRRAWDQAMTKHAMADHEQRILSHVSTLDKVLSGEIGNSINMTEMIYFLAFDVMGDFAFAKTFNMLESREWHYTVILLRRALALLGPISPVPWLAQIAFGLPVIPIIRDWNRMIKWCVDCMTEQVQNHGSEISNNISSHLIQHSLDRGTLKKDSLFLRGDSVAMVVAGSDTVAATLVFFFYQMILHPEHVAKIRDELASLPSLHESKNLADLQHMEGCISEVLRLHPSVPTGGYRESPPEGLEVAGTYLPGNTVIVSPTFTINRSEKSFPQPLEFIPERWYARPDMITDSRMSTPFSIGRYSCVGKKLALMEIRLTIAMILSRYDIVFAPGEDGTAVWKDMRDQFTAVPGRLNVVLTPRGQE